MVYAITSMSEMIRTV